MDEIFEALIDSCTGTGHRLLLEHEPDPSDEPWPSGKLWLSYYSPDAGKRGDEEPRVYIARVRDAEVGFVVELFQGSDPRPYDYLTFDFPEEAADFLKDEVARR